MEAGVIAGIPTGAIIGGEICKAHGILGVAGGSFAGLLSGAVIGWLYALVFIFLLSVVGVLWKAARKRADAVQTEADMALMTPIAIRGIFISFLMALICWFNFGWLYAFATVLAIGIVASVIAVARYELR